MIIIQSVPPFGVGTREKLYDTRSFPRTYIKIWDGRGDVQGTPVRVASDRFFCTELHAKLDGFRKSAKAKFMLAQKFDDLARKWKKERGISSSLSKSVLCPSYLRIIAMGPDVVPLILHRLREEGDNPDYWFRALETLIGENPVQEDDVGDFRAMAQAWLEWSDRHAKLGAG